jgi:hypothetical protein
MFWRKLLPLHQDGRRKQASVTDVGKGRLTPGLLVTVQRADVNRMEIRSMGRRKMDKMINILSCVSDYTWYLDWYNCNSFTDHYFRHENFSVFTMHC